VSRVVIVGAGLGGLSAACHLAGGRHGAHDVVVLERASVPGGRAGMLAERGYRIDSGPSVLTMVDLLESTFAAAGTPMHDLLTLAPVDPMYRACFEDGSTMYVRHGREAMAEEIRSVAGAAEAASFHRFADWLTELYRVEMPHFIDRNFDSPLSMASRPLALARLLRLGGFGRVQRHVERYFRDERIQRMFSFQTLYAGLSPMQALGAYAVITYMDSIAGVFFPKGGIHAVATGLVAAAEKAGAQFRYDADVDRVLRNADGSVRGVRLTDGEVVAADIVVVNADLPVAYQRLLPDLAMPRAARKGTYSPSCVTWLVGASGPLPAGAAHHNIHFGKQWSGAFEALLKTKTRQPDPSILISAHTVGDPDLAPPGSHALHILEPTPNLDGSPIEWEHMRAEVHESLRARCVALGYPVSAEQVEVERLIDPVDWERMGMAMGTPFALSHTFRQTGPFRPGNVDRRAPGLVFVGSSTVPGVGVPMVLVSGRLAAERVAEFAR
jgi:phytoene desaturase